MSEEKHNEAPRFFHVASWTMAIVAGVALATTIGLVAFNMAENPISASTTSGETCAGGVVAINNYPYSKGTTVESGGHQAYYNNPNGESFWRCSAITVPNINQTEACNSVGNQTIVANYLKNAKTGGALISVVKDKAAFDNYLKTGKMSQAVILSSSKSKCEGSGTGSGGSKDYEAITDAKDGTVAPTTKNTTYVEPAQGSAAENALSGAGVGGEIEEGAKVSGEIKIGAKAGLGEIKEDAKVDGEIEEGAKAKAGISIGAKVQQSSLGIGAKKVASSFSYPARSSLGKTVGTYVGGIGTGIAGVGAGAVAGSVFGPVGTVGGGILGGLGGAGVGSYVGGGIGAMANSVGQRIGSFFR